MPAMACCARTRTPIDGPRRRRAAWALVVLGVVVLRGALPCQDAAGLAPAIDRLIAASLCASADPARAPGGAPLGPAAPWGEPAGAAPACLHCGGGQGGLLVLAPLVVLAFAGWRPRLLPAAAAPRRRLARWPTAGARGPPWPARPTRAGATAY